MMTAQQLADVRKKLTRRSERSARKKHPRRLSIRIDFRGADENFSFGPATMCLPVSHRGGQCFIRNLVSGYRFLRAQSSIGANQQLVELRLRRWLAAQQRSDNGTEES
jgi:hypothetical protein